MSRLSGGRRGGFDDIDPLEGEAPARRASARRGRATFDDAEDGFADGDDDGFAARGRRSAGLDDGPMSVRLRDDADDGGRFDDFSPRDRDRDDESLDDEFDGDSDDGLFSSRLRDGPPASEARRGGAAERPFDAVEVDAAPDRIGRLGWLAGALWVGGVSAFVLGLGEVPITSATAFAERMASLPTQLAILWAAVAIAPLGFIWMTVAVGRRAREMARESARVTEALARGRGAGEQRGGAAFDSAAAQADLDAAADSLRGLERSFAEVEQRAQVARDRLEAERTALADLVSSLDGDAARIADALSELREGAGSGADALAERIAAALAASGVATRAPAPMSDASEVVAPIERPAPRPREPERRPPPAAPEPGPQDAVARAAEAARASFGDGAWSESDAQDTRSSDGAGRLNALRRRIGRRAARESDGGAPAAPSRGRAHAAPEDRAETVRPEPRRADPAPRREPAPRPAERPAPEPVGLDWRKLIRAANFPDSEDDRETLDALYAVLTDPEAAALLQAAEDTLSALADIGLFMEDLQPHHAPADRWRAYIVEGDRDVAMDLGGVRDEAALDDVSAALDDKIAFREASSRFVDRYERILDRLFDEAPDPALAVELADTRSGRAYMLLGRASGRFS